MAKLEIKSLSGDELIAKLAETEQEHENLRFSNATSTLANPSVLGIMRRDIARIKTELRQRELAALEESGQAPKRDRIRARRKKQKKN